VAQAEGISRLVSPREATIANRFVALLARQRDAWKICAAWPWRSAAGWWYYCSTVC
jgi:hypothetical protein